MASFTPLLIAPFTHGLQTDLQPWIAPKDSFSVLTNFHVEHGFLERRNGYSQFGTAALTNGTPVIGLEEYIETSSGAKTLLAWDTTSAYTYDGGSQTFSQLTPSTILGAAYYDYIWAANWQSTSTNGSSVVNRLYFTDGNPWNGMADPNSTGGIRYFDGGTSTTLLAPTASGFTGFPYGAKFIFALGQRLVFLNTYEGGASGAGTAYPQRARWCAKQNPGQNGWDDAVAGQGDFADAATSDQIISARILQNQIIAQFTDSVWALIPTSDPAKAFRWVKLNDFRACGGRKASVQYDKYIGAIGNRGVTATDGANTSRVDDGISNYVTDNIAQNSFNQVFCGRDYNNKRWWSLYPSEADSHNDRALIYDDDSGSFSTYNISLNCLGYGSSGYDYTWDDFVAPDFSAPSPPGGDIRWKDFNNDETFESYYFQENTSLFLGGGYDGTVYVLESNNYDVDTAIPAEFLSAAWNPFTEEGREAQMSYIDIFVETSPTTKGTVYFYKDSASTPYFQQNMDFLPNLGFVVSIDFVDITNPCLVTAYQHGLSTGDQIYIYLVEGMEEVNSTEFASYFTVTVVDENSFTLDGVDATAFNSYTGGGGIYLQQFYRTKTWKRAYAGGIGFWHQIGFTSTGLNEPYRIHGLKPYFRPIGKRTIN